MKPQRNSRLGSTRGVQIHADPLCPETKAVSSILRPLLPEKYHAILTVFYTVGSILANLVLKFFSISWCLGIVGF